jgi:hypothetical protein
MQHPIFFEFAHPSAAQDAQVLQGLASPVHQPIAMLLVVCSSFTPVKVQIV